jgi:hypothetical protein
MDRWLIPTATNRDPAEAFHHRQQPNPVAQLDPYRGALTHRLLPP